MKDLIIRRKTIDLKIDGTECRFFLLRLCVLLVLGLFSAVLQSAELIAEDTTWGPGMILLEQEVQVDHGVTLKIAPGTTVEGNENQILLLGTLDVRGQKQNIILNDLQIRFYSNSTTPGSIIMKDVQMLSGDILNGGYGSFDISDSLFVGVNGFYIWYPTADSSLRRNVFKGSSGLSIGLNYTSLDVRNNLFIEPTTARQGPVAAIFNWSNYSDSLFVENNSFESIDTLALAIDSPRSSKINAKNNYFGTTDESVIQAMIRDRNDSLEWPSVIEYEPFLLKPHVDTPTYEFDNSALTPIVDDSGQKQIIAEDTTWGPGVIFLEQEVQVDHGVTLKIAPGTTVEGNENQILLLGTLDVRGQKQNIILNDLQIRFYSNSTTPGSIIMKDVQMLSGDILNGGYGSFDISDSLFVGVNGFYIWYPTADSSLRRNVFKGSSGLSIGLNYTSLDVRNNLFIEPTTARQGPVAAIFNWSNYSDSLFVENNSFESIDTLALAIDSPRSSKINAKNNYFGTTDESVIQAMIRDRNDSLVWPSVIEYKPFLLKPHVDTPEFNFDSDGDGVRDNYDPFPNDGSESLD
ncbi:hypothetical protein N9H90_10950, partial [Pseudomonadales bacterium]|nr:hypothetical protein [Pseudomonadales bacterium]